MHAQYAQYAQYAQVAVLAQLGRAGGLFTYRLPEELAALAGPGTLVEIPFSNRQLQGVVYSLEDETNLPRLRDVTAVLDPVPVLTTHQLQLARWISEYYAASVSDVIGAMIPPGLGRKTVYMLEKGDEPNGARLTVAQRAVLEIVGTGRIAQDDVQHQMPGVSVGPAVALLVRRRLLTRIAELAPPRSTTRAVKHVSLTDAGRQIVGGSTFGRLGARQRDVLNLLGERSLDAPEISRLIPNAQGAVSSLLKRGLVETEERPLSHSPFERLRIPPTEPLTLSPAQQRAFDAVAASVRSGRSHIFLLHGVTGSGKTEVYLQAIEATIESGRQAIMMVPEISLTPQAVERVAGRFPGRVAVLHSKLSPGERMEEWQRIRHGQVAVVVGPRSALFAPLPHPGLIIVDEEHDPSYKQDASPRYNARDAAAVLGRMCGATVVFGSATPDVGTFHAAQTGRIALLELPNRPVWGEEGARPMPSVEVVDMRHELKAGNRSMFSEALLDALDRTLADGHQALLFLNRRGSATVVLCRDCGYVARCPNCDIPFTYHAAATRLICHRCDKRAVSPHFCPACRSPRIRYLGAGTQRVEEEVARLFPRARVLRWDRDVTGGKEAHEQILQRFSRHEADVLVGTQMIAKGLDFPLVTLVGVVSADTGLHMPDFRAPERSFQLLTQVAGRAGRSSLPSRVVVQTYTPEHYAVQAASRHDYHRFYEQELQFRVSACYPPFARLVRFVYSSGSEGACRESAENLKSILRRAIEEESLAGIELIGPAPCFISKIKNRYYWQLIARGDAPNRDVHPLLDHVPAGWTVDVDPVDLL